MFSVPVVFSRDIAAGLQYLADDTARFNFAHNILAPFYNNKILQVNSDFIFIHI